MPGIDARALRAAWTVSLFVLAAGLVYLARRTLVVFVLALFFAHLVSPLVDLVERFTLLRTSRTAALVLVYLAMLGAAFAILAPIAGEIGEQAAALAGKVPEVIQQDPLTNLPLPSWLETFRPRLTEMLREQMAALDERVLPILRDAGLRLLSGLGNVLSALLVPILAFFFLKDGGALRDAFVAAFPTERREQVARILSGLHALLAKYMRALVLLAAATFASHSAFLALARVPYPILLAGVAAILEFIPVVGPLASAIVLLLVAAFAGYPHLLWIAAFLGAYRLFQDYVLNPYLMSSGIAVPPLLVLFGVLAGEAIAGIPGMFFAVPLMASLRIVVLGLRREIDAA